MGAPAITHIDAGTIWLTNDHAAKGQTTFSLLDNSQKHTYTQDTYTDVHTENNLSRAVLSCFSYSDSSPILSHSQLLAARVKSLLRHTSSCNTASIS